MEEDVASAVRQHRKSREEEERKVQERLWGDLVGYGEDMVVRKPLENGWKWFVEVETKPRKKGELTVSLVIELLERWK